MKTKSKTVKRKSPYDSDIECNTMGASKKQNSESLYMFPHLLVMSPTQKGNPLPREHVYGSTDITSESVGDYISTPTSAHTDVPNASITKLLYTSCITRKEKDLCIHGPHQLPNSKGNIQFTPDAIEYPSAIINVASTPDSVQTSSTGVTNHEHSHSAHDRQRTITPNVYHKKKQLANYHIHQPQPDGRHQSLFNKVTGTPNHKTIRPGSQTVGKIPNHSDIHNASSTDLSAPSSMATILRIQPEQLYPHVFKQIPMNKGNIQVTPDAIQSPSARVTIPKHNHAA
ncbi:hypothetical protein Tco_0391213 [Tanacetum coccineum]